MRLFPGSAALCVLLLSACEKKGESSRAGDAAPAPVAGERREREARAEEEIAAAKGALRAALEAARRESDPAAREKAIAAVAWDGLDVDPALARTAFEALTPGGDESRRLVGHFAMRLADHDPDAALEWARALPHADERGDAIGRIAVVISTTDPVRGATLAAEEVPEGLPRDRAILQIVQRWSQSVPAEAGEWVSSFPDGRVRLAAIQNLANTWFVSDAPAFQAWALKDPSRTSEAALAVAAALRVIPDETRRNERLAALSDAGFRGLVEDQLKNAAPFAPPPAGGSGR